VKADSAQLIQVLAQEGGTDSVAIKVESTGPSRWRYLYHLAEYGLGVQWRVHCSDVQTALRGLLERVFFHWEEVGGVRVMTRPFRPTYATVNGALGEARAALLRYTWGVRPLTRAEFLAPLGGSKLRRYTAAADANEITPITKREAVLKTFVKAEKLNVTAKSDPDPRVIQPRDPRYCYELGLYTKACEPMIYKAINRMFREKVVMKGKNADQRGEAIAKVWHSYRDPVAIGMDASRWDQHVAEAMLQFEHSVYNSIFHDPWLRFLLVLQLVNIGVVFAPDGRIKYTVRGSRMSGDMNTALGNVLLMCLLIWSYLRTKLFRVSLINDGDDSVLICERQHSHLFADLPAWFANLGFVMKVEEPVDVLEKVAFCQAHPVEIVPGVWRMVRDPRVTLDKDLAVVKPITTESDFHYHRNAIGQCGLALAGDVPVLWQYYQMMCRGTSISKRIQRRLVEKPLETGMDFLAHGMEQKFREPHPCSRVSFFKAFGITPDLQVALEKKYSSMRLDWFDPIQVTDTASVYGTSHMVV